MATTDVLTNPLGATVVMDGGNPRTFTGVAKEIISGGQLVTISGATGEVGSGIVDFQDGDIDLVGAIDSCLCNGIALNNGSNGDLITVATRGAYLIRAGEVISGGAVVGHNESGMVENLKSLGSVEVGTLEYTPIGRAMSTCASGAVGYYSLIYLNV